MFHRHIWKVIYSYKYYAYNEHRQVERLGERIITVSTKAGGDKITQASEEIQRKVEQHCSGRDKQVICIQHIDEVEVDE